MTNSKKVKMSLNIKNWLLKAQLIFVEIPTVHSSSVRKKIQFSFDLFVC